ncbi:MAG: hypothetical protein CM15mP32_1700 [Flavobacteriaceae bacterium]|nr:MAG: hypothetical protein CM15mP32_1700 [Flavobacteriaceae bacterium]
MQSALSGFSFRSVGPAFMSGRIADIAIDPTNENVWYVAVGSGGTWKTTNAGTTWTPLTDDESFYSTGCITLDPNNSSVVWLGTGEMLVVVMLESGMGFIAVQMVDLRGKIWV